MFRLVRCFTLLAVILFATSSFASTFAFSYSSASYNGSGIFTADLTATPGTYLITGISGTANGSMITALVPAGGYPTSSPPANDNKLFFPAGTNALLDDSGVSFSTAAGTFYNLFYGMSSVTSGANYTIFSGPSAASVTAGSAVSLNVAATPEPSSLVLLGTGLVGMVASARRRLARA